MATESPNTLAAELALWAVETNYAALPPEVVQGVKDRLLDTLGVALAGASSDAGGIVRERAIAWGGEPQSSIIGESTKVRCASAALVNGTYAHSLDFDDTHLPTILHPSAPIIPAVLAQAQALRADGRELVAALAVAYEVACRLGMAQYDTERRQSMFVERGLHVTSYVGAIASAVACATLLSSHAEVAAQSISISAAMGAGLIESSRSGGSMKKFQSGWAAHCGVTAAELAQSGLTGAPTALEGKYGFFQALVGNAWRRDAVTADLGTEWLTPSIAIKAYPCTHFTHSIVDAALRLRRRGVEASQVQSVEIGVRDSVVGAVGEPEDLKRKPTSAYLAQFSGPFIFASAFVGGGGLGVSMEDFTEERLADPVRMKLSSSCTVVSDDACDAVFPEEFPARVTITLDDGTQIVEDVMATRGGRKNPLTPEDLEVKLSMTAGQSAAAISTAVSDLESAGVEQLLAATVR